MNMNDKKRKKLVFPLVAVIVFVAGLADIKYKGLFYRLLSRIKG